MSDRWVYEKQSQDDSGYGDIYIDDSRAHRHDDYVRIHNADCDAYEARIAEMERERDKYRESSAKAYVEAEDLRADLARVKAESLRVVEVTGADYCVWCDGSGSWLEPEYESGGVCVGQVENTCIHCLGYRKPVRLERWETEE